MKSFAIKRKKKEVTTVKAKMNIFLPRECYNLVPLLPWQLAQVFCLNPETSR